MRNAKILPELASAGILTLTNLTIYNIITEKEFDMKKALFTCAVCACLCTAALAGCSQATAFGLTKKTVLGGLRKDRRTHSRRRLAEKHRKVRNRRKQFQPYSHGRVHVFPERNL